jgi:hypothetical protein
MSYPPQYGPQGQQPYPGQPQNPGYPPAPGAPQGSGYPQAPGGPPPAPGYPQPQTPPPFGAPQQPFGAPPPPGGVFAPAPPKMSKKGPLAGCLGLVAVVVVFLGIRIIGNLGEDAVERAIEPERTANAEITESGSLDPLKLQVGDCYHNDISQLDTTETVRSIEAIPCSQQHNAQVISETTMSGTYPLDSAFLDKCETQVQQWAKRHQSAYRQLQQRDPNFSYSAFFPLRTGWSDTSPNRITCSLVSSTGNLGQKLPTL